MIDRQKEKVFCDNCDKDATDGNIKVALCFDCYQADIDRKKLYLYKAKKLSGLEKI